MTTFPRLWALLGHICLILLRLALPVAVYLAFVFGMDWEDFWERPGDDADLGGYMLWGIAMGIFGIIWCGVILVQLGLSAVRLKRWQRARNAGDEAEIRAATLALHSRGAWGCAVSVSLLVFCVSVVYWAMGNL